MSVGALADAGLRVGERVRADVTGQELLRAGRFTVLAVVTSLVLGCGGGIADPSC